MCRNCVPSYFVSSRQYIVSSRQYAVSSRQYVVSSRQCVKPDFQIRVLKTHNLCQQVNLEIRGHPFFRGLLISIGQPNDLTLVPGGTEK